MLDFLGDEGLKLLIAVALGGVIGIERERVGKPAGLRTNILIAVGSALITLISLKVGDKDADPGRIAAQIVTGVGFIGAGTIIQARGAVVGLTTAATLWAVAGIGMAVGAGQIHLAVAATTVILLCLIALGRIERSSLRTRALVTLTILCAATDGTAEIVKALIERGVTVEHSVVRKTREGVEISLVCEADPRHSSEILSMISAREDVATVEMSG